MNWKEKIEFNKEVLDGLNLPEPKNKQDMKRWMLLANRSMEHNELPPELDGDLFKFMSYDDLAEYLQKRFGAFVEKVVSYKIRSRSCIPEKHRSIVVNNGSSINGYSVSLLCPKCGKEIEHLNYGGYDFDETKFRYSRRHCPHCGWRIYG